MKVIINNIQYNNISWLGNGFSMETDMTLAQIESAFTPDSEATITVIDGEQEIAKYYNKGIDSITVMGSDTRTVTVLFNITQIAENAEAEIRESIDVSDGAIAELAELIAEQDERITTLEELDYSSLTSRIEALEVAMQNTVVMRFEAIENVNAEQTQRIEALEEKLNEEEE